MSNLNPVFGQLTNAVSGSVSNPQELAQLFQDQLQSFANRPDFAFQMGLVFSPNHDYSLLQGSWATGNFASLPKVEMRSGAELQGANGVYAKETQTIYLSEDFVSQHRNDLSIINSVLLEEFGHYIDDQVNLVDTTGDEGEIFSAFVRGKSLTEQRLTLLKMEDDTGFITLDGNTLAIEKATDTESDPNANSEDDSAVNNDILALSSYTGNNLNSIADGIDQLLNKLQETIIAQVYPKDIPLLGEILKNRPEFKFIDDIRKEIAGKLADVKDPQSIEKA